MRFEDLLLHKKLLDREQLGDLSRSLAPGVRLDQALIQQGILPEPEVLRVLAEAMHLEVQSVQGIAIEPDVLALIPPRTVFRQQVLPLRRLNGSLQIATSDPFDLHTLDELHAQTGLHVEPVLAPREEIANAIKQHFGVGGETVGEMVLDHAIETISDATDSEDPDQLAEQASVIRLVNEILTEAIDQRTSDIHIEPMQKGLRIRYRIDGVLQVQALPPEIHRFARAIVSRLKIMAKLNIAEKRLPQDGRIELRSRGREVDIRVSIIPMTFGEGVVLRILDKSKMTFSLESVGMMPDHMELWTKLIDLPHGILLVTGPTGSGKTTTLYSALQQIANDKVKVITVEDPVEYQFDRIQQIQVSTKIGLTFAAGLRSILRHDPDVVLIGEIRDLETAEIATQASLTGHLVFSTLHTNDSASAFTRLTDMGIEPFLVASTVEGVLAQRLVRLVCKSCGEDYHPDSRDLPDDFPLEVTPTVTLKRGVGCRQCLHTGYKGRQGIFELMPISDPVRELVVQRASSAAIKDQALREGLVTLRQDAWRKLLTGRTSLEEVLRVTKSDQGIRITKKSIPAAPRQASAVQA